MQNKQTQTKHKQIPGALAEQVTWGPGQGDATSPGLLAKTEIPRTGHQQWLCL